MTVREFINHFNPELILDGRIGFKVIGYDGGYGDKWFFYRDKYENPDEDTIDKFCNNEGIRRCMSWEVDELSIIITPEYEPGFTYIHLDAFDPEYIREIEYKERIKSMEESDADEIRREDFDLSFPVQR